MNIDATEAELSNIAEVLKLAAILDDRAPKADKARIVAWAEQVHRHKLTRDDLLDGLQRFYDGPSERAIAIGDLVSHSKASKRDRIEREDAEIRDIRREEHDSKADADETRAVMAAFVSGPVAQKTKRLHDAEHGLQFCHGKAESIAALREYFEAKKQARKNPVRRAS